MSRAHGKQKKKTNNTDSQTNRRNLYMGYINPQSFSYTGGNLNIGGPLLRGRSPYTNHNKAVPPLTPLGLLMPFKSVKRGIKSNLTPRGGIKNIPKGISEDLNRLGEVQLGWPYGSAIKQQTNTPKLELEAAANKEKFYTSYSKKNEIKYISIGLASPEKIKKWAEKTLPNGKMIGQVLNANTLHHKTFKPPKGGLFCERIFGPLKDFFCGCGKSSNMSNKNKMAKLNHIQATNPLKGVKDYLIDSPNQTNKAAASNPLKKSVVAASTPLKGLSPGLMQPPYNPYTGGKNYIDLLYKIQEEENYMLGSPPILKRGGINPLKELDGGNPHFSVAALKETPLKNGFINPLKEEALPFKGAAQMPVWATSPTPALTTTPPGGGPLMGRAHKTIWEASGPKPTTGINPLKG
jgi:hypothetical protein